MPQVQVEGLPDLYVVEGELSSGSESEGERKLREEIAIKKRILKQKRKAQRKAALKKQLEQVSASIAETESSEEDSNGPLEGNASTSDSDSNNSSNPSSPKKRPLNSKEQDESYLVRPASGGKVNVDGLVLGADELLEFFNVNHRVMSFCVSQYMPALLDFIKEYMPDKVGMDVDELTYSIPDRLEFLAKHKRYVTESVLNMPKLHAKFAGMVHEWHKDKLEREAETERHLEQFRRIRRERELKESLERQMWVQEAEHNVRMEKIQEQQKLAAQQRQQNATTALQTGYELSKVKSQVVENKERGEANQSNIASNSTRIEVLEEITKDSKEIQDKMAALTSLNNESLFKLTKYIASEVQSFFDVARNNARLQKVNKVANALNGVGNVAAMLPFGGVIKGICKGVGFLSRKKQHLNYKNIQDNAPIEHVQGNVGIMFAARLVLDLTEEDKGKNFKFNDSQVKKIGTCVSDALFEILSGKHRALRGSSVQGNAQKYAETLLKVFAKKYKVKLDRATKKRSFFSLGR